MAKINTDAEIRAYRLFLKEGMTPEGACGLIGNLEAESDGFVPGRVEYLCLQRLGEAGKPYTQQTYTAAIDSGKIGLEEFLHPLPGKQYGYGLAQWTSPGRKQGLWEMTRGKGLSIADESAQIEFLLKELRTDYKNVLAALKSAKTIREASDTVLKKFEQPADTGESACVWRAARGSRFYNSCVRTGEAKEEQEAMGVRMSNCGHDENSKYSGGKAGDQTGNEWYLREWYSYPWDYVLRWKDPELGALFADLAIEAAQNEKIGYDQGQRETFRTALASAGWRPANIKTACEADCSSGTVALIKAVGNLKGISALKNCSATYTGDMMPWFRSANGKKYFKILAGNHLTDPSLAKKGDINLNEAHHVNITVDNGANAGAESAGSGATSSTGGLIGECSVNLHTFLVGAKDPQIIALQLMLKRLKLKGKDGKTLEIDGELGDNTAYAVEQFQRAHGFAADTNWGTVAGKTWLALMNAMK